MRYLDFLRTSVMLFAASATVLGTVALLGAHAKNDTSLVSIAVAVWAMATVIGGWIGRGSAVSEGIARLLADARTTPLLPELQPGTILFNRLWALAVFTVVAGGLAFLVPQVPAVAAAFPVLFALAWRKQSAAVAAIEERDGVRFYVEYNSPFKPTRLLRTPGFRKNEPAPTDVQGVSA
ncbi:MAG: hypothetical protein NVSMB25_22900 [Thermoleophilaceae bacterium]